MSTISASQRNTSDVWIWAGGIVAIMLLLAAAGIANLLRARLPADEAQRLARRQASEEAGSMRKFELVSTQTASGTISGRTSTQAEPADRKIVRTSWMELTVGNPAEVAEKIRGFADSLGGYVETARINSSQDSPSASITIRVPAARLEDAKTEIRKLAVNINSEKTDAQDMTKQYVDLEARIRNLRAQESQYLEIMRSAKKVQDMLDVSEKLSQVRGEIEQQQAEFGILSKQVETVAIAISLLPEPKPESFGLNWQPLHRLQVAGRDALDAIADYASTMASVILYLPAIVLWMATILMALFGAWKILLWAARFFRMPKPAVSTGQSG